MDIGIVRIFNTYGPRMRKNDGRAIPNFVYQALENKDFTIYGDGTQTRSFCYVEDTVEGINKLLESNYQLPINIGNPEEYKIIELVEKIKDITNSKSQIKYLKLPENDPKIRKPCIKKAKNILRWLPKTSLEEGLKKTINYNKKLYNFKK